MSQKCCEIFKKKNSKPKQMSVADEQKKFSDPDDPKDGYNKTSPDNIVK